MKNTLNTSQIEEKEQKASNGLTAIIVTTAIYIAASIGTVLFGNSYDETGEIFPTLFLLILCIAWLCLGWIVYLGIKIVRPNEALVLTLFGQYTGTLKKAGIFFVNPFSVSINPAGRASTSVTVNENGKPEEKYVMTHSGKISLKAMTLDNKIQKINDRDGNPVEVRIVVVWRIVNTARAVFCVNNYAEYISIQADSTLRDVAGQYPYDGSFLNSDEEIRSLRGSSAEVAAHLRDELQKRVENAGIEIIEARITHLAYAPEIAAAMLQRQQAAAIIEARQKIVDGAVGMVEMALERITENHVCDLDDERKAQMVSNLLVVLCGNKDAQPIVNSGSIY